jgi:hypothetical protein
LKFYYSNPLFMIYQRSAIASVLDNVFITKKGDGYTTPPPLICSVLKKRTYWAAGAAGAGAAGATGGGP